MSNAQHDCSRCFASWLLSRPPDIFKLDMGYHTELKGVVQVLKPLTGARLKYLHAFTDIRHMRLDYQQCQHYHDPLREAVGLPSGFWTIADTWSKPLVRDRNCPGLAPSLNCPWKITEDGSAVMWNGVEKPKGYDAWLEVLGTLLKVWGHDMKGTIQYEGEEGDRGDILVNTTLDPLLWTQTCGKCLYSSNLTCELSLAIGSLSPFKHLK